MTPRRYLSFELTAKDLGFSSQIDVPHLANELKQDILPKCQQALQAYVDNKSFGKPIELPGVASFEEAWRDTSAQHGVAVILEYESINENSRRLTSIAIIDSTCEPYKIKKPIEVEIDRYGLLKQINKSEQNPTYPALSRQEGAPSEKEKRRSEQARMNTRALASKTSKKPQQSALTATVDNPRKPDKSRKPQESLPADTVTPRFSRK